MRGRKAAHKTVDCVSHRPKTAQCTQLRGLFDHLEFALLLDTPMCLDNRPGDVMFQIEEDDFDNVIGPVDLCRGRGVFVWGIIGLWVGQTEKFAKDINGRVCGGRAF